MPPRRTIDAPHAVVPHLRRELSQLEIPLVEGLVWTTDAPYRETLQQIEGHADRGALAVEMQAASLFGFAAARGVPVAVVAHVSNAIDHGGVPFDRGPAVEGYRLLQAICRGGTQYTASRRTSSGPPI